MVVGVDRMEEVNGPSDVVKLGPGVMGIGLVDKKHEGEADSCDRYLVWALEA